MKILIAVAALALAGFAGSAHAAVPLHTTDVVVAAAPADEPAPPDPGTEDDAPADDAPDWGGIDVGLDASPSMAPDPEDYVTEVLCPNGQVWAVAIGDDFVCPASLDRVFSTLIGPRLS